MKRGNPALDLKKKTHLPHTCSICKKTYRGFGNNAQPLNDGRCCDKCNTGVVIPIRIGKTIVGLTKKYGHK